MSGNPLRPSSNDRCPGVVTSSPAGLRPGYRARAAVATIDRASSPRVCWNGDSPATEPDLVGTSVADPDMGGRQLVNAQRMDAPVFVLPGHHGKNGEFPQYRGSVIAAGPMAQYFDFTVDAKSARSNSADGADLRTVAKVRCKAREPFAKVLEDRRTAVERGTTLHEPEARVVGEEPAESLRIARIPRGVDFRPDCAYRLANKRVHQTQRPFRDAARPHVLPGRRIDAPSRGHLIGRGRIAGCRTPALTPGGPEEKRQQNAAAKTQPGSHHSSLRPHCNKRQCLY